MMDNQMPIDPKPLCRCVLCIHDAMRNLVAAVARREGADPGQVTGVVCGLRAKPSIEPGLNRAGCWPPHRKRALANGYEWTPCGRRVQLVER